MIDTPLLPQIDDWIATARTSLLTFWRGEPGDFWRDTECIDASISDDAARKAALVRDYFPTATYMSVSVLVEPGKVVWQNSSAERFSLRQFLELTRPQFDTFEKITPVWSPHTASWAVKALRAVYKAMIATRPEKDDKEWLEWLAWIKGATSVQARNLIVHLEAYRGATLAAASAGQGGKSEHHGHPLFTAHALSAIRAAQVILGQEQAPMLPQATRRDIGAWSRRELDRIIAQSVTGWVAPRDLLNLPYHALSLCYLGESPQPALLGYVIRLVCQHQIGGGGWPLLGAEFSSERGNRPFRLSSFEMGAALLRLSMFLQESMPSQRADEQAVRHTAFQTLFDLLRNSFLNVEIGGREFTGWTTNHAALDPTVESWATALGLRFLRRFRHFTQLEVQEDVLNRYETTIPFHMKTWIDWEKIEGLDSQTDAKAYIQKHFIDKLNFGALPNKEMRNVSMILFGPPGTSKTTIAKAVAKQLNWPLVTITPSLFLSNGPPGIDSQATRVFSDLRKLQSVVVFFDECDELFRARSAGKEKFSSDLDVVALITGAMLPRLQDLHDRGRLIFILATNRIDAIDNAVRRQGRFDHVVSVGPPDRESRNLLLESRGVPTRIIYTLAPMLDGFTRDEVLEAGSLFAQLGEDVSGGTVDEVLRQRFGENARSIPKDAYEEFKKQREMYCSAWKSAELHRASGQASPTKKRKASSKRSSK